MKTLDAMFQLLGERPWYDSEDADDGLEENRKLASRVISTVQDIERKQCSIFEGNRRHARIYSGYLPSALGWGVSSSDSVRTPFEATKAVIRSVCDTATALIVRSRPRAAFVTDGGDWKVQIQAEDLEQFCVGAYDLAGIYQVAPRCFHDSTVFGTGLWKYVPKGSGDKFYVATERVNPDDFVVDEDECRDSLEPQNTYHRMVVRADSLIKKYASKDADLARRIAANKSASAWPLRHVPKDYVVLVEAIHVDPENPKNSRRVLCLDGVVLKDETWPYEWHPYTVLWWSQPLSGFYGDGIAYRQFGRQSRITYMYRWIQRCHDLFATPRAWVDPAGGPPTMQLSNEIGQVITARKTPVFQVQDCVPGEIYHWLDNLERGGYEDEGISQSSAQNQLPVGIESAPAQREYSFKEGQRFAPVSQRWETALACETATKLVAMYRRHATSGTKPVVRWADTKMMYKIEWPDLKEDAYVIRPEAASLESLSPASRIQSALELAQTGWLKPGEGRALVGHPDLREADELGNAGESYAKFVLRKLYRAEVVAVDDKADLAALDRIVRSGRLLAIQRSAPRNVVDTLDHYLEELDHVQMEVQTAMQMQQGPANMVGPTNQVSEPFSPGE